MLSQFQMVTLQSLHVIEIIVTRAQNELNASAALTIRYNT